MIDISFIWLRGEIWHKRAKKIEKAIDKETNTERKKRLNKVLLELNDRSVSVKNKIAEIEKNYIEGLFKDTPTREIYIVK
jgi:hypothetical protein